MVRVSQRQDTIKFLEMALENNLLLDVIDGALGLDDKSSSDEEDRKSSSDKDETQAAANDDLLQYIQAVYLERYFGMWSSP
ncbi:hypothetical protein PtA15_2A829 [Puccinia triticina]|uniref:Uncharacterized protein n=1 Tax=Puccinia triticina TaxID=208348 RepID=A0ABY7CI93_9BASI|nr:uncharacterized protein PtA15_2A829 [Puccinia triticina]WAQ82512.1 hypothetical protein PtA15_2A829 [Puccinia triticina]